MTESQNNSTFRVLAACLLGAAMFAVLPASATTPVRDAVRLAVSPGQRIISTVIASAESRWQRTMNQKLAAKDQLIDQLQTEIVDSQFRERRFQLAAESAARNLATIERTGVTPFAVETARSLIRPRAVRASVLGREILSELNSRRILDRGESDGVSSDLWVLKGDLPIVQAGSALSVADGLPVFAGRCIVGRIVEAGRWTSSLQYLTEPGFRARAVLARDHSESPDAATFAFGAEGLIEGRSDWKQKGLCELTQIPATEHVDMGMSVYSPPGHAVDAPMLFGHVVSAEVPPGALHWVVTVRPAVDLDRLRQVEIVVPELDTEFQSINPGDELLLPSQAKELPLTNLEASPRPGQLTTASKADELPKSHVTQQRTSQLSSSRSGSRLPLHKRGSSES
jgi:rod shape-determining protein MreC